MSEEIKQCPYCGEKIKVEAKKCRHCGEWLDKTSTQEECETQIPPSQFSSEKEFPPELNKFNWGVFLWTWIWGLTYGKPITLIYIPFAFIPVIGAFINLGLCIWLY